MVWKKILPYKSKRTVDKLYFGKSKTKTTLSFKTKLIKAAGGYGGFINKYKKDPFYTTESQAEKLVGRNTRCFCGSGKKVKKCCLKT